MPACPPARLPACPPARLPACPPAGRAAWRLASGVGRRGARLPPADDEGGLLGKLHRLVRRGLPARVIDRLEKHLGLSPPQSARLLAISETSRKRYKHTPAKRLDEAASDRIVRLMTTVVEAEEIFGDRSKAIAWLKTPSLALDGLQPLELMTSDPGAQLVRDELNRIRYGHWA